ncbi:endo-beta-N-acetylglucosaminidase, partial [Bacteroides salyersiae]|uniref:endo-beta-N-acetylglucosaminidase n=1 Tax=Bacteroides salyersiae TaxID=291644 RepID=UPI001392854A
MKLKQFLFSAALLASMNAIGQSVPTHEMYVDFGITERTDIVSALDKWQPGDNFSNDPDYQDENFFISRVPLKSRFINQNTQANKNLNEENNKNLCWCSPIGEMTKKWGPMPRYNFDGDNFNMWQYINIHANWSNTWFRVPGTFNDVAHKNGVRTGCLYFIDWAEQVSATSSAGKMLAELCAKDGSGNFKYARKLIQFLKYYGIDGLGLNPEGYWSTQLNEDFSSFLAECHKVAKEMNHPFHVEWYAFVSNAGGLNDNG